MSAMASQITGVSTVYWTACSGADQRKHQSSASLAFVWGIHRWPVNSSHKRPVTRKMFPFDDVIMHTPNGICNQCQSQYTDSWTGCVADTSITGVITTTLHYLIPRVRKCASLKPRQECRHFPTFWTGFSFMKMYEFRFRFNWSLFLRFALTILRYCFRWWLVSVNYVLVFRLSISSNVLCQRWDYDV